MSGFGHRLDLSPMRPLATGRTCHVSVLDIGSRKVGCVIAKLRPRQRDKIDSLHTHDIEVVGFGYHNAAGIKSGVVMDMEQAERSIRRSVDAAERMAGATIDSVFVNVSCGRISSDTFSAEVDINGYEIGAGDVQRVLQAGRDFSLADGRVVLHSLPIGYALDGERGITDPVGMVGRRLGVDMNIVTADLAPVRNLLLCLERCHLDVEAMVATPYASALGAVTPDEMRLGTACVDIGAGTTNVSVFFEGSIVFADTVPLGSHHVTMDLARGLSTSIAYAERFKTLYGSALPSPSDDTELINVPQIGSDANDDVVPVPRSTLTRIIRPRIEEILEFSAKRLKASGAYGVTGGRLVLTGGGSLQTGLLTVAERIFETRARLGRPQSVEGLPETAHAPSFSALLGLLVYPQVAQIEHFEAKNTPALRVGAGGYFGRIGRWLKESF